MNSEAFRKMMGLPPAGENQPKGKVSSSPVKTAKSIRIPKVRKMSKPEKLYGYELMREFHHTSDPSISVLHEPISLRLHNGTLYSPDWVVMNGSTILLMVEVKGSYRLKSAALSNEKFKSAIVDYPQFKFRHAQLSEGGEWIVWNSGE